MVSRVLVFFPAPGGNLEMFEVSPCCWNLNMLRTSPRPRSFLVAWAGQLILTPALVAGLTIAVPAQIGTQGVPFEQLQQQINALAAGMEILQAQVEAMGGQNDLVVNELVARVEALEEQNQLLSTLLEDLLGTVEEYRDAIEQHEETIQALRDKMVYDPLGSDWLGFDELLLTGQTRFRSPIQDGEITINGPSAAIFVSRPVRSSDSTVQPALWVNGFVNLEAPRNLAAPLQRDTTLRVKGYTEITPHQPLHILEPALRVFGPTQFVGINEVNPGKNSSVSINLFNAGEEISTALVTTGIIEMNERSAEAPYRSLMVFSERSSPIILREATAAATLRALLRVEADPLSSDAARVRAQQFIATPTP
jgi:hypothetical protein